MAMIPNTRNAVRVSTRALLLILISAFLSACSQPSQQADTAPEPDWPTFEDTEALAFVDECKADLKTAREQFNTLESSAADMTDEGLLDAINNLDITTDRLSGRAGLTRNVHPNAEVRDAADLCQQKLVPLGTDISLSRPIFERLQAVDTQKLDALDQRYVEDMLLAYERSGVDQDEPTRQRIRELNEAINRLGQSFNRNVREDDQTLTVKPEQLAGLPEGYIENRKNDEGLVVIGTDYPDYFPVMQYAERDSVRFDLYKMFRQRGYPENQPILKELLSKRHELATLLGYRNYAHYVTEDKMIEAPEKAQSFIDRISRLAESRAQHDYHLLLDQLQEQDPEAERVGDWQKTYLEEQIKQEQFQIDSRQVREYFHYDNVRQGIFDLTETLFDVQIVPWETDTWHESVQGYELRDQGKVLGRFYLDMHPRQGKYNHAAAFTLQSGVKDRQLPIVALVCNFPGGEGSAGYMEHSDVTTFLHEFGHLLHAIFGGHQERLAMSGIRTEWDFVEAPSQMLEEWIWDADTLKTFARNAEGETIPDSLVKKMNAAREFGRGLDVQHQMFYAALSLNYYNRSPEALDLVELERQLQRDYSPFDPVDDTYFHASFGHLYGYSAIYYTYMWSKVIATDLFSQFQQHGMLNPEVAQRYRETILEPGGTRDAADLVEDFLGRPYSFDAFAKKLEDTPSDVE